MKNAIAILILTILVGCHHRTSNKSTTPRVQYTDKYAKAYERKGIFAPYSQQAMSQTIIRNWSGIHVSYPAEEQTIISKCAYLGGIGAKNAKQASVYASRIGATHIIHMSSSTHVSGIITIGYVAVPRYGVSRTYNVFRCVPQSATPASQVVH